MTDSRRAIVRDSLAVALATGAYGTGFGALSVASGLSVLQTCVTSLLIFTGASQFALVGVVGSGGNPFLGMLSGLLLGTRNTLYGLRMGPLLGWRGWRRAAAAHVLIDESTAMGVTRADREDARTGFLWTGIGVFVLWNLATLVGALAGDALGDPRRYGLDAAAAAAFLGLLWPRLTSGWNRAVALAAAAVALVVVPLSPAGVPVLVAGAVAVVAGLRSPRGRRRTWSMGELWLAVLLCGVGCYLLKLAGMSLPEHLLERPVVRRVADLIPVALLAALVGVQAFASGGPDGQRLVVDARVAGLGVAFVALLLRAPFLVVVVLAAATAALVRLV